MNVSKTQKKILFIINPISGVQKKAKLPEIIEKYIDKTKFDYSIRYTERVGHATYIAKDAVSEKVDIVVAVGGDGSVNEVAQSLIDTETALAIIPMGSGNGLATHLKLPLRNARKAIQILNKSKLEKIDVGVSNYGSFVSCAGIGIEAAVTRMYRHHPIRGFLSYFIAVNRSILFTYRSRKNKVKFIIDGNQREENIYLFTVFNSKFFGYKVGFATKASLQDGYFDLVLVKGVPIWKMPLLIILALIKKLHLLKETEFHRVKKVEILEEKKRTAQLDGDSFIASKSFKIEIKEKGLKLMVRNDLKDF